MMRVTRHSIGRGLLALGIALLTVWSAWWLDSFVAQGVLGRRLESLLSHSERGPLRRAMATRREARTTGLVGRIEIPRLRLSAIIVEGDSERSLRRGVGHVEPTAFPGEHGNVALAAHRDTYFRSLRRVSKGDAIRITTPDGVFRYRVESIQVVSADRDDLLAPTRSPRLTLVTCYPFDWIGPAPRRFVVVARPMAEPTTSRVRFHVGLAPERGAIRT
jgi:sortase A